MRASKIAEQEIRFSKNLINTSRVKYTNIQTTKIPGATINHIRPKFDSYFYNQVSKKDLIVLHSTVGTLRADMASLTKLDQHVSVSYVISRSGNIYELFDPNYWSYHLGKGSVGGNKTNSKRSIGIELSNYGPLNKVGDSLETMYSHVEYTNSKGKKCKSKRDAYCDIDEIELYTEVSDGFRGYKYFASFTDDQYIALDSLLDYLCDKHDIPREFINEDDRYSVFKSSADAKSFKGIASHVNFRKTGKWDLGPDFNWSKITDEELVLDNINIISKSEPKIESDIEPKIESEPIKKDPESIVQPKPKKKRAWWITLLLNLIERNPLGL